MCFDRTIDIGSILLRRKAIDEPVAQILMADGSPGILLHARRRMKKTTWLNNLMGFIPSTACVCCFILQSVEASGSTKLFCERLVNQIHEQHPEVAKPKFFNLVTLSKCLNGLDKWLKMNDLRILIGLDE